MAYVVHRDRDQGTGSARPLAVPWTFGGGTFFQDCSTSTRSVAAAAPSQPAESLPLPAAAWWFGYTPAEVRFYVVGSQGGVWTRRGLADEWEATTTLSVASSPRRSPARLLRCDRFGCQPPLRPTFRLEAVRGQLLPRLEVTSPSRDTP